MLSAGENMTTKQKNGAARWQAMVREFEASPMNLKEFCETNSISRYALQYWRRKTATNSTNRAVNGLVEIIPTMTIAPNTVGEKIRIIFPSGIIVEPGADWKQDELTRTLAAVKSL
jgi:hypothetical protein